MQRAIVWRGLDAWRAEACHLAWGDDGGRATGTQIAADPVAYRMDYALDTDGAGVTRRLEVTAAGEGWDRSLVLTHDGRGVWTCAADARGAVALPAPGGPAGPLAGALDCDLGLSPLTNSPPVRRAGLHRAPGSVEMTAAWISVPDLGVHADRQRYEHLASGRVRFTDLGLFPGFTADLELDDDGLVLHYPGLAVMAGPREPASP